MGCVLMEKIVRPRAFLGIAAAVGFHLLENMFSPLFGVERTPSLQSRGLRQMEL